MQVSEEKKSLNYDALIWVILFTIIIALAISNNSNNNKNSHEPRARENPDDWELIDDDEDYEALAIIETSDEIDFEDDE